MTTKYTKRGPGYTYQYVEPQGITEKLATVETDYEANARARRLAAEVEADKSYRRATGPAQDAAARAERDERDAEAAVRHSEEAGE
jgi:hypothetical protein